MTLKSDIQSDFDNVILNTDEMAESITYTPDGGSGVVIKGIPSNWRQATRFVENQGKVTVHTVQMAISKSSTVGIASPKKDETVLFDSKTWTVLGIDSESVHRAVLELEYMETFEDHSSEYEFD